MKKASIYLIIGLLSIAITSKAQVITTTPDTVAACIGDTILVNVLLNDTGIDIELVDIIDPPGSGEFNFLPNGTVRFIPDPDDFNSFQELNYIVCEDDDDDDCELGQLVFYLQAYSDCVWPGDANTDGAANHFDLLNIGLYYSDFGPNRYDEDNSWDATYADIWDDVPTIGTVVPKFADCNGDGFINADDTLAIQLNYGLEHALRLDGTDEVEATPLYIDIPFDTIPYDTLLTLPIMLGSELFPGIDIYGLAFTINYNPELIVPGSMAVNFDSGWLGTEGDNLFAMRNAIIPGALDVSVSRNNKVSASGTGQVGTVSFVMESNLAGKMDLILAEHFELCVNNAYGAINEFGEEVILSPGCDSVVVSAPVDTTVYDIDLVIFPNPAASIVKVKMPGIEPVDAIIEIRTLAGTLIKSSAIVNSNQGKIKVSNIPNGTYNMVVVLPYTVVTEPFVILH